MGGPADWEFLQEPNNKRFICWFAFGVVSNRGEYYLAAVDHSS